MRSVADGIAQAAAGTRGFHGGVARERAGDFAVFMTAHAVCNQPKPFLGIGVVGVFIEVAAKADVAEVAELDHG